MRKRTPNMQRSRWPLEPPEDALEKHPSDFLHAHATNAAGTSPQILVNPNANAMQRYAMPRHAMPRHATPDKLYNLLLVVN